MPDPADSPVFRICVLATGGTIEKTYDARAGELVLDTPVIADLLAELTHPDIDIRVTRVMSLDSLEMGEAERETVCAAARLEIIEQQPDALVVTHGTDTLSATAMALDAALAPHRLPVVLTGAMRPYRVAASDARQNVAQAIMAAQCLAPGVYGVLHGRAIPARRLLKDHGRLTFIAEDPTEPA